MKEFDRMSVDDRRVVSADDLRREAIHQAENWLMAFGALIPADQIENLAIKLAADIAKPAIETVVVQAEQIAAELARVAEARVEGYRLGYADADNGNDPIEWASR